MAVYSPHHDIPHGLVNQVWTHHMYNMKYNVIVYSVGYWTGYAASMWLVFMLWFVMLSTIPCYPHVWSLEGCFIKEFFIKQLVFKNQFFRIYRWSDLGIFISQFSVL